MHDLKQIYNKVHNTIKKEASEYFPYGENSKNYPNLPKLSDLGVISLAIAAESVQVDSENLLWSKIKTDYPNWFKKLPHRTRFNNRRKSLSVLISLCTEKLAAPIIQPNDELIIDSIPIPICQIVREKRVKICRKKTDEVQAAKGFHASSRQYYLGYKLHLIASKSGVYVDCLMTPANVSDNYFLKIIDENCTHLHRRVLLGDRAYIGREIQGSLFENYEINLQIPFRKNQKDFENYPHHLKIKRKTIETVFSQYCDEFLIKRIYAKSFEGLFIRILSKIAAKTFKQLWNFYQQKPINQTKHALAA